MRRFLSSAWFPFVAAIVLGGAAVAANAFLPKLPMDIYDQTSLMALSIAGWATGPVAALLSLALCAILNGIRWIVRARKVAVLHPIVVVLGILPWLAFSYELLFIEPHYTVFAVAIINVIGRPLFVGSFSSLAVVILFSFLALVIPGKSSKHAS